METVIAEAEAFALCGERAEFAVNALCGGLHDRVVSGL